MGEKINNVRLNAIGLILLLVGLGLIGFNLTGKAVYNSYTLGDYCSVDNDCINDKVCCVIPGVPGMCQTSEVCEQLKSNLDLEKPLTTDYSYLFTGMNLIIFAVVIFIIAYMGYKIEKGRGRSHGKAGHARHGKMKKKK